MELVTGAMGSLIPKLWELLKDEYKLQKGVKDQVRSLALELESAHAALHKVAEATPDQLDELVRIWAREVRQASYDMEDILDTFLVRVQGGHKPGDKDNLFKRAREKMTKLFNKSKERHDIAGAIKNIKKNLQEVTELRGRYTVDTIVAKPTMSSRTVDPRLRSLYTEAAQMIGIVKSKRDLISMLSRNADDESNKKMKIVSIVGVGGLGKTTLAKAVYDELKSSFGCGAFVPVGRNPDLKKFFRDTLIGLDKGKYTNSEFTMYDERQLIDELQCFLTTKRYFIVIDDVWEIQSWEIIKLALVEENNGSRIITTTRKLEVTTGEVYELQPLSYNCSKKLFYTKMFGGERKGTDSQPHEVHEASEKILKKCGGVPLAIITMASLLVGKSWGEWLEVCNSIGFRDKEKVEVDDTMWILSLSYYDLPSHLRICLLYLSAFPEDYYIDKHALIWKWIAEGFVHKKPGIWLFEVGEGYFHDLINRSMIQAVHSSVYGIIDGCRVHDMVLDLLRSLSHEENFITVLDITKGTSLHNSVRRLAYQNGTLERTQQDNHMHMPHVRSFLAFRAKSDEMFWLPSFKLLRVLALENCTFREGSFDLEHIGNLLHLRYLGIQYTHIHKLPEEIGALKFLQTLDLTGSGIKYFFCGGKSSRKELPSGIASLTQLVRLRASGVSVPNGVIGKLTSMEELLVDHCDYDGSKRQFVEDLGNLCELKVLMACSIRMNQVMQTDLSHLMQSLGNLQKMQRLTLDRTRWNRSLTVIAWDAPTLSRHIRHLILPLIHFSRLPPWISSSSLPILSHLDIDVDDMDEQGLKTLGGLPGLCYLNLKTRSTATLTNVAADGCFQKLRSLLLPKSMVHFLLNKDSSVSFTLWNRYDDMDIGTKEKEDTRVAPAAMPNLQELEFVVYIKHLKQNNGRCDILGLEYLPLLQKVNVELYPYGGASADDDVEKEESALRHAIEAHPNRPTLHFAIERHWQIIEDDWVLDSGAEIHHTYNLRLLRDLTRHDLNKVEFVRMPDGNCLPVLGRGSVRTELFNVPEVSYVKDCRNVISIMQLEWRHGLITTFGQECCSVRDPETGKEVGRGRRRYDMYVLDYLFIEQPQDAVGASLAQGTGAPDPNI